MADRRRGADGGRGDAPDAPASSRRWASSTRSSPSRADGAHADPAETARRLSRRSSSAQLDRARDASRSTTLVEQRYAATVRSARSTEVAAPAARRPCRERPGLAERLRDLLDAGSRAIRGPLDVGASPGAARPRGRLADARRRTRRATAPRPSARPTDDAPSPGWRRRWCPALVAQLDASGAGELEVREGDWRVRLRRPPMAAAPPPSASARRPRSERRAAPDRGPRAARGSPGAPAHGRRRVARQRRSRRRRPRRRSASSGRATRASARRSAPATCSARSTCSASPGRRRARSTASWRGPRRARPGGGVRPGAGRARARRRRRRRHATARTGSADRCSRAS